MSMSNIIRWYTEPQCFSRFDRTLESGNQDLVELVELESALSYFKETLDTDRVLLKYLTVDPVKKQKKLEELRSSLKFFNDLSAYELKVFNRDSYEALRLQAGEYIAVLDPKDPTIPKGQPLAVEAKPVAYLVKEVADYLTYSRKKLSWINTWRLTWVFDNIFMQSVFSLIAEEYYNKRAAKSALSTPQPYADYASFILYYLRGSIDMYFILQDTFAQDGLEVDQRWERFLYLVEQKKYSLMNDWLWAFCNMVCHKDAGLGLLLGPWGDLIALCFFTMDLCLALAAFVEQKKVYEDAMEDFANQLADLDHLIKSYPNTNKEVLYTKQKLILETERLKYQNNWEYNKKSLLADVAFAFTLVLGFTLLVAPIAPGLPIISVAGAILCYVVTVIYRTTKGLMALNRIIEQSKLIAEEITQKKQELGDLITQQGLDSAMAKLAYMELQALLAKAADHQAVIVYEKMHLMRATLIEILIPAVLMLSFIYLPAGIAIAIVAAAAVLAVATYFLIEKYYKKEPHTLSDLNESEYHDYFDEPEPATSNSIRLSRFPQRLLQATSADNLEEVGLSALVHSIN